MVTCTQRRRGIVPPFVAQVALRSPPQDGARRGAPLRSPERAPAGSPRASWHRSTLSLDGSSPIPAQVFTSTLSREVVSKADVFSLYPPTLTFLVILLPRIRNSLWSVHAEHRERCDPCFSPSVLRRGALLRNNPHLDPPRGRETRREDGARWLKTAIGINVCFGLAQCSRSISSALISLA